MLAISASLVVRVEIDFLVNSLYCSVSLRGIAAIIEDKISVSKTLPNASRKKSMFGGITLGTDIVLNPVSQLLSDILWFTFVIINFRADGYCLGKNLWLIDKALYILIPANPSIVKLKSAGIKPTIFEGLFSTLYI